MIKEPEQEGNISACVEVLASLRFDNNFIQQFLREEFMRESAIYQEIIQEGKRDTIIRQLKRRIGTIPLELQAQIQKLSIEQLDTLSEVLLDFSDAADLTAWLQAMQNQQS